MTKNGNNNFQNTRLYTDCFLFLANYPKPKDTYLTITHERKKQKILTFEKLEQECLAFFA